MNPEENAIETDVVIVGAGPVGLFQAFELGLLEMRAQIIDSLPQPGGQCSELYPDKPIYDIPGLPFCTGQELTERLLQQMRPFAPGLHLDQEVSGVAKRDDGRFDVTTSAGQGFVARAVVVAAGVGAFQPRTIKLAGLEAFHGTQVLHRAPAPATLAGARVLVSGDTDAAFDAALALVGTAASVTLLHRRDEFRAAADKIERMRELCRSGRMRLALGQPVGFDTEGGRLTRLQLACADGSTQALPLDTLLVLQGLSPRLGPIAGWGLALERKQIVVDTASFETGTPGLFAVGDIVTYPGKRKLILCGFHEATLAAYGALRHVRPSDPGLLQYTTTSPRLHALLGVASPAP